MDKSELEDRVKHEAYEAIARADRAEPKGGMTLKMAAATDVVRPLVERIVELEESATGLVRQQLEALTADVERVAGERDRAAEIIAEKNAEIDRLEAQSKADAEHRATLAQEVIDLNTALEEADRRLKASEARATMYRSAFIGACHLFAAEEARSS